MPFSLISSDASHLEGPEEHSLYHEEAKEKSDGPSRIQTLDLLITSSAFYHNARASYITVTVRSKNLILLDFLDPNWQMF